MTDLKFNINNHIYVKLTDHGYQTLVNHLNKYCNISKLPRTSIEEEKKRVDSEGYYQFQMWDFCHIFGPSMYNGCKNLIEDNLIKMKTL